MHTTQDESPRFGAAWLWLAAWTLHDGISLPQLMECGFERATHKSKAFWPKIMETISYYIEAELQISINTSGNKIRLE